MDTENTNSELSTNNEELKEQSSLVPAETTTEKPQTQQMEVHHHSHAHGKKNWKTYFFEFFMLFLAVFCGFLAEYQLEQTIERHREKEFIVSMLEDAATDTANIHVVIAQNTRRIQQADSLATYTFNFKGTQTDNSNIYMATRKTVYYPELVYPTDRTLFQLKNAGGMRLIRNKKAVEAIVAYDNSGKNVVNQQAYYEHYLTALTEATNRLMNFSVLLNFKNPSATDQYKEAKLLNPTPEKMQEMGNMSIMFQGVMLQYVVRLRQMEKEAVNLMATLKKEYHLN
jgi:hypothetical protein